MISELQICQDDLITALRDQLMKPSAVPEAPAALSLIPAQYALPRSLTKPPFSTPTSVTVSARRPFPENGDVDVGVPAKGEQVMTEG